MAKTRTLNASQAQKIYGVSRVAIGKWIKAGKLLARDGIFFEDDFLVVFNASKRTKKIKSKSKPAPAPSTPKPLPQPKTKKRTKAQPQRTVAPSLEDLKRDAKQKHSLDTQLAAEKLETQRIKNAKDRSELISRDLVRAILHRLFTIHTNELKPIGQKIAPELMSFAGIEEPAIEAKMSGHIYKETHRVLEHIKREFMDFLELTRGENHSPEDDEI